MMELRACLAEVLLQLQLEVAPAVDAILDCKVNLIFISCISSRKLYHPLKATASNQPNRLTIHRSCALYLSAPIITPIPNELRSGLPLAK
jgi:hypothetical protein